jgi:hypothetical protein
MKLGRGIEHPGSNPLANLSSLASYARGGRFRRPPRGRAYQARRATTMTAAAIATTATVEAATTTPRF